MYIRKKIKILTKCLMCDNTNYAHCEPLKWCALLFFLYPPHRG